MITELMTPFGMWTLGQKPTLAVPRFVAKLKIFWLRSTPLRVKISGNDWKWSVYILLSEFLYTNLLNLSHQCCIILTTGDPLINISTLPFTHWKCDR